MSKERPVIDYEAKAPAPPRIWGLSRPVWLLLACFCVFVEFVGWVASVGPRDGWGDSVFILTFALVGVVALLNALRPTR